MAVQHSTNTRANGVAIFEGEANIGIAYGWDGGVVHGAGSKAVAVANARLWAAAPKLLSATLKLEEAARFAGIADPREREEVRLALEEVSAAIIDARGC